MHSLSFDKLVYSDAELTTPVEGPFDVGSTTVLPSGVYFSETEYVGEGRNANDDLLWTVTFNYPGDTDGSEVSLATGAIYS